MKDYLKYLFQLILSPGHGWEDIEKGDERPERLLVSGYYPIIAIAALSVMLGLLHHGVFITLFLRAIVWFVVLFVGYFFGVFMLSVFVEPMVEKYDEAKCQTFALFTLGLEAVILVLYNVFPFAFFVITFLPCYVALIQWKGAQYMQVKPQKVGLFMILSIFGVLMPPYVFYYLFSLILG